MSESTFCEDLPLHKCIFNGDIKTLSSLIRTHDLTQKDKQGIKIFYLYAFIN